ncbi:MAG: hypothetical protein P1U82_05175, partial [Verrucomicrobiales bacterium]|nr:hypothetical protein [Verrucomicrobiales bacterium]
MNTSATRRAAIFAGLFGLVSSSHAVDPSEIPTLEVERDGDDSYNVSWTAPSGMTRLFQSSTLRTDDWRLVDQVAVKNGDLRSVVVASGEKISFFRLEVSDPAAADRDGDGVDDAQDAFPDDPTET